MQPDYPYGYTSPSSQQNLFARIPRKVWAAIVPVILVLIGFFIWNTLRFHIVSTDPDIRNVATITPYIKFNFNQTLNAKDVQISSSNDIVGAPSIDNKTLTLNLNQTLIEGKTYTITLKNISSTSGSHISNKVFSFTAKNIAFNDLSKAQQQAILKQQTNKPYTKDTITYIGFDELVNQGMAAGQADSLKQAFYNFSKKLGTQFKQVTVDTTTLRTKPLDRNNPSLTHTIYFTVSVDSSTYDATVDETGLTIVRLYLSTPNKTQYIYDSGAIDTSSDY